MESRAVSKPLNFRNGKSRLYTFIYDNNGKYKIPKFNDVRVSTMTIICYTNLIINIDKFFEYIPTTDFVSIKKKRGRKKKIQPEDPNRHIPPGSIISVSNKKDVSGTVIKTKKKSGNFFRHSVTTIMMLEDKKMLNVKISKQGKFQMTGCKNIQNAIDFMKYLYSLLIETEEWIGETLFTYKTDNLDLEDSTEDIGIFQRETNNGLMATFKVAMMNIDFSAGYKIRRDLLNNFINKYTEYRSIYESSITTSVNIKIKSNNKFDKQLHRLRITHEGDCIEEQIAFEDFFGELSKKEQEDDNKKEAFHTFRVFASGSITMSSSGMEMANVFYKLVKLLIENRERIEEKEGNDVNIETEWLDE